MTEKAQYERWLDYPLEDLALTNELAGIKGKDDEIFDRFYQDLSFGTAGLRGVIGAGSNRMNIYTVRRATQGMAEYLQERFGGGSVAISYDSRINSDLFAKEAARVLAASGIKAYLYRELMPTPALSFAVREIGCQGGIMITASHNPAKYNGYKAYGPDGCQMTEEAADAVLKKSAEIDILTGAKVADFDEALASGMIEYISDEVTEKFLAAVYGQSLRKDIVRQSPIKVVYTPLNGAGGYCVGQILSRIGADDVVLVKEQELPDGNFPTCPYPNPEIKEALAVGLKLCETEKPDILLATDPDCDRVGIAVRHGGEYKLLTGNDVGVLLTDYSAATRKELGIMPQNPLVVKTIVTTTLIDRLGEYYGFDVIDTLTGFKYIGEQILRLEEKGEEGRYIFGFEESYGYLSGGYVRDKDAVDASMLICEMTAYYKKSGKTLIDILEEIYARHGYHLNAQQSFAFEGAAGMQKMAEMMEDLRKNPPVAVAGKNVLWVSDYLTSEKTANGQSEKIMLPASNVIELGLEGGSKVIIRPSGTEPKIKFYFMVTGDDRAKAQTTEEAVKKDLFGRMGLA